MVRTAIVTGANRGIGNAIAVTLARQGYDLGLTWHEGEEAAEEAAEEVRDAGQRAFVERLDLSDPDEDVEDIIRRLADELGVLDVLVNNAGTGGGSPFLQHDLGEWRRVLEVDLTGAFRCAQVAARRMAQRGEGGRIINITSVHEHVPLEGSAAYCAAKGGLGLMTRVAALELAEHGITVNAVAPGEIATRMTGQEDVDPRTVERPGIPAGRPGDAHEVAALVAFLASPEASYITGVSYVVDGGMLLMAAQANQALL